MAEKLTPWFPVTPSPMRPGVYAVINTLLIPGDMSYSYFDGKYWNGAWTTVERAASKHDFCTTTGSQGSCELLLRWRGLASDPKKANHD